MLKNIDCAELTHFVILGCAASRIFILKTFNQWQLYAEMLGISKCATTSGIKFATYLSKDLKRKVLYVADEEKISGKLQDKFRLFNAYNQNLSVTGKLPKTLQNYEVVFLDSVTSMGMEPEELEDIQEKYPQICFVYILQTNKQGSFYGKKKWEHLCDVVLRFEDGIVKVEKNRFGKVGEYYT